MDCKGKLKILVQNAKILTSTDSFGKMDPYVKITLGKQIKQTKVHSGGDKEP